MCFAATKFRLNRLRRWPSSSLNPLVGFQNSACMLHAHSLAAQLTTQSQFMIVDFQHVCPLHNSPCQLWTQGSYNPRPFQHTARSGNELVPLFCKSSTTLVATASSFVSLQLSTCELLTFAGACVLLRNQFVVGGPRRRDYSAPPAVFGLSHSLATLERIRSMHTQPAGFLTKQATRSGMFTVHRQVRTHGHKTQQTRTLPTSRFPNGECSLQNKAKWYNDNIPINATH